MTDRTDDNDNDMIATLVRDALDGVTLEGEPVEWVVLYYPKRRAVTAVNMVGTPGADLGRQRDACEVAVAQIDHTV